MLFIYTVIIRLFREKARSSLSSVTNEMFELIIDQLYSTHQYKSYEINLPMITKVN